MQVVSQLRKPYRSIISGIVPQRHVLFLPVSLSAWRQLPARLGLGEEKLAGLELCHTPSANVP